MTTSHLTAEDAGRWVTGLLEPEDAAPLEAHVERCAECTRLLQDEARVELVLQEASRPAAVLRFSRLLRLAVPLAAAAALTLAFAWGFATGGRPSRTAGQSPAAQLFEVPRYEGLATHVVLSAPAAL